MSFPILFPNDIEITRIARVGGSPYETTILINISTGFTNTYIVYGNNVDRLSSVNWYPRYQENIIFRIMPLVPHNSSVTVFGINVLSQESFDSQRGGVVSFRTVDDHSASIPALTISTYPWLFNPTIIPLQGYNNDLQDSTGGAH